MTSFRIENILKAKDNFESLNEIGTFNEVIPKKESHQDSFTAGSQIATSTAENVVLKELPENLPKENFNKMKCCKEKTGELNAFLSKVDESEISKNRTCQKLEDYLKSGKGLRLSIDDRTTMKQNENRNDEKNILECYGRQSESAQATSNSSLFIQKLDFSFSDHNK